MAKTVIVAEPGLPYIDLSREFNASPEFLFRAHTDPELFVQWIGPRSVTANHAEFDLRNGGLWRYVLTNSDGSEVSFRGVYHGAPSVEGGIVQTVEFEQAPGEAAMETTTFEPNGSKTVVRQRSVYFSVETRDSVLATGMEYGVEEGNQRIDELIERMATPVA